MIPDQPVAAPGNAAKGFHHSRRRIFFEVLLVVGLLALAFFGLRACANVASSWIVSYIPASVDANLGALAGDAFRTQYSAAEKVDEAEKARVQAIFDELYGALTPEEKEILQSVRLTVLSTEDVNAFALPGGEVFVLTGLLGRTKGDDDMLRGVLAHELGHAVHRHGVRKLVRANFYGLLLTIALGGLDQLTLTLAGAASQLEGLSYSRSMEEEADAFGVELLRRTGHSPEGLARFLESLGAQPVPALLSTHPDNEERARNIRALAQ